MKHTSKPSFLTQCALKVKGILVKSLASNTLNSIESGNLLPTNQSRDYTLLNHKKVYHQSTQDSGKPQNGTIMPPLNMQAGNAHALYYRDFLFPFSVLRGKYLITSVTIPNTTQLTFPKLVFSLLALQSSIILTGKENHSDKVAISRQ